MLVTGWYSQRLRVLEFKGKLDDLDSAWAKLDNPLPFRGPDRHIDRAEEEGAREPHVFERLV